MVILSLVVPQRHYDCECIEHKSSAFRQQNLALFRRLLLNLNPGPTFPFQCQNFQQVF